MGKEDLRMSFTAANLLIIGVGVLVVGILIGIIRLLLGPTAPDRVVALDTVNTLVVGIMIALGAYYLEVVFIDIAIVYAILSWVTTLFIAKLIGGMKEGGEVS
jgi:multicomponent Na+:H+ antiporter subunit F